MPNREGQPDLLDPCGPTPEGVSTPKLHLRITFDLAGERICWEWCREVGGEVVVRGWLIPSDPKLAWFAVLDWVVEGDSSIGRYHLNRCHYHPPSVRALLNRIRKRFPFADDTLSVGILADKDLGPARQGVFFPLAITDGAALWKFAGQQVTQIARILYSTFSKSPEPSKAGSAALQRWAGLLLVAPPEGRRLPKKIATKPIGSSVSLLNLKVTFHTVQGFAELVWTCPVNGTVVATGRVRVPDRTRLTWEIEAGGQLETRESSHDGESIRECFNGWLARFATNGHTVRGFWMKSKPGVIEPVCEPEPAFSPGPSAGAWILRNIADMAKSRSSKFSPIEKALAVLGPNGDIDFDRYERRLLRKGQHRLEEEERLKQNMARLAEERRRREQRTGQARQAEAARRAAETKARAQTASPRAEPTLFSNQAPLPAVPVSIRLPELAFQEAESPIVDLRDYSLRESASLWWVSNQSDDLLCLPHCRINQLDYQLRTALRVLGPLRGRALLSDEVGLGKTIEAGLVLKELLTRGMVKRFLVLTVPSLVDQWEEELSDKFGLATVTTNQEALRGDARKFWGENSGIVASLHTLKQPAHLEIARQVHWDMLIVDEAHYLRNRESQAWLAVNVLPRQFLLLLTATPVQNSLEDLYNLVTLLQPGQLPSPKQFRARFVDPKRPRQPREPEELRRLLGQVMIRNTRANAGLKLPPRRAETVLFEPDAAEKVFWEKWETEFRAQLAGMGGSQSSLWGRLLLQSAGSSPAAWRAALQKFPNRAAAELWRQKSPLEGSWQRKCELLTPLTKVEGGAVVFTQFLETQAALALALERAGVEAFVVNGATPATERQPITEEFRKRGGALLLTQSGTEGRNLQFCHHLANFDLPWNPMEIEQRIGRLHRLGQQHPVRIYNFVQAGTLQEHLLQVLQEKLNLFELVVGETGLVLGERFSSDEFADEVLRRWRENEGRVAEAFAGLGEELAAARDAYSEVKQLDETLFAKDYESI